MDAYQVFVTWTCLSCNQYCNNQFLKEGHAVVVVIWSQGGESQNIYNQKAIKLTN